jgi:hypothetical protein
MKSIWSTLATTAYCLRLAPIAMATVALGCSGPAPAPTPTVPGLPADFTGPGVYTVPAYPTVEFAVPWVHIEQNNGVVSIYYDLPPALAGRAVPVDATGTPDGSGPMQLSGDAGTSACTVSGGVLSCEEQFSGIHLSPRWISPRTVSDPQQAAREAFAADPIGNLVVALPN